jgi:uncharacterized protein
MRDEAFEWDDAKAAQNILKHGVTFDTARKVFDDPNALDQIDGGDDYGEDRYWTIGTVHDRLFYVVYATRNGRIRIISARGAEPHERRRYHEKNR